MLDAGVSLRDVQSPPATPDLRTTKRYDRAATTSTVTPTTSSPSTWPPSLTEALDFAENVRTFGRPGLPTG